MSLTEDDKIWINERLDKVDGRLDKVDERLDKMETTFSQRFEKMEGRFDKVDGRLAKVDERFEKMETTFSERLEKMETTLLTEFHKWASPLHTRQRSHTAVLHALDVELEDVADRVSKLEGRKAS